MKTKRFTLLLLILLLSSALLSTLTLALMNYSRFAPYDWPRNLEYNSMFWIEMGAAAVELQILLPCIARWLRLFANRPIIRKNMGKAWNKRFAILSLAVLLLTGISIWRRRIYYPAIREQLDDAWIYANRYYPFVIADLFAVCAWIRCLFIRRKLYE